MYVNMYACTYKYFILYHSDGIRDGLGVVGLNLRVSRMLHGDEDRAIILVHDRVTCLR